MAVEGGKMIDGNIDSDTNSPGLRLRLLGGWRLHDGDVAVPTTVTMRRLLAALALRGPMHRGAAATLLWPDSPTRQAAGSLRELLWRTRQAHPDLLCVSRECVALGRSVQVDVPALRRAVAELARHRPGASPTGAEFAAGELLPGWSEPWVEIEREQLRQLQLVGLELLAERRLAERAPAEALPIALAAATTEPLRESAQRMVVRAHLAMGNYGQAVAQFERFSDLLDEELGVRPSREFADLLRSRAREEYGPRPVFGHPIRSDRSALPGTLAVAVDF
jgi:DNA-binding SARP family transcriptional activator